MAGRFCGVRSALHEALRGVRDVTSVHPRGCGPKSTVLTRGSIGVLLLTLPPMDRADRRYNTGRHYGDKETDLSRSAAPARSPHDGY